jgi:hypothetical protein
MAGTELENVERMGMEVREGVSDDGHQSRHVKLFGGSGKGCCEKNKKEIGRDPKECTSYFGVL